MKTITQAIYTKFTETLGTPAVHNSFYLALNGRMYKHIAPQNVTFPYCVYHLIDDVPDWTFTTYFENARIQFDFISKTNDSTEIEDLYTKLKTLFDWCTLSVTGYSHLYMRRELVRLTRETDPNYWVYNVDYLISVELT